jgi:4-amino-4-deoxy-L-arabinose transferase-like glycosyltransferase
MTIAQRPRGITILVIALISASAFFIQLGSSRLDSWDEAIYAQAAKEMVRSGDWITPHWNEKEFFQKPPLLIWLTALLFKIFGVSETTARAISALSGVGVVLLTLLLARRFFDELPAVVAAVALLVSAPLFQFARSGTMDVLLTFLMLLAVYAYVRTGDDARWWLFVGLGCGLAVMTKGAAALPLLGALLLATVWDRKRLNHKFWTGLLVFIVVGGTWHFAMIYLHGKTFLNDYLGQHVLARAVSGVDEGPQGIFFYLPALGVFLPLLPFGLFRLWKQRDLPLVIPILCLLIILFYTVISTKHAWYILPALPFLSILVAPARGTLLRSWVYAVLIVLGVGVTFVNQTLTRDLKAAHASIAELSIRASRDSGTLGVFPEIDFGPEVLFYSNRPLCVDQETQHTMARLALCAAAPAHIILPSQDFERLSAKYHLIRLATSGGFAYCRVDPLNPVQNALLLRR